MPMYLYEGAGRPDDIYVIEDPAVVTKDGAGVEQPAYRLVDARTVRAHPKVIAALVSNSERLWNLQEVLDENASSEAD